MLLLSLIMACTGTSDTPLPPTGDGASPSSMGGWIAEIALQPNTFETLLSTGKEGWIKLHANDYLAARDAFIGSGNTLGQARAEWSLGVLHGDLARLQATVNGKLFDAWEARTGLPRNSAAPVVAGLAAFCAGESAARWADKVQPTSAEGALLQQVARGIAPWKADTQGTDPFTTRMRLHQTALSGDPAPLMAVAGKPIVVEPAQGFRRKFYDPCVHKTLSDTWMTSASKALGGNNWRSAKAWADADGLEGRVFAAWLSSADLNAELGKATHPGVLGATAPSLKSLGLSEVGADRDDMQSARSQARALDAGLMKWRDELVTKAGDDGRSLLVDLRLIERYRQEWLNARARKALLDGKPKQALALLELAVDVSSRDVGPTNAPHTFALLAEARLGAGRTREALDALKVLAEAHPEVEGLREVTGDLAVLQGLDRQGDSKEN